MQKCEASSCKLCKGSLLFTDPRPRAKQQRSPRTWPITIGLKYLSYIYWVEIESHLRLFYPLITLLGYVIKMINRLYCIGIYPITPQNHFEPQEAAAHCCCSEIAPVFLCFFFSFCLSHSGSVQKIEMSYKTWQDANMRLPEGIWKCSCWFCNCRGSRHPSNFHPRKGREKKYIEKLSELRNA